MTGHRLKKPTPHFTPGEMLGKSTQDLNTMRSFPALVDFVYHLNSSREPHEPFVRFRKAEAWERIREKVLYVVCMYDLAKDMEQEQIKCSCLTVARGYMLGILATRRFRKNKS